MRKVVFLVIPILLAGIITAAVLWKLRSQVITLKDGTKLTLVGVSYGQRHVLKGFKIDHRLGNGRATLDTTNDTLVVWVETQHKGEAYELFVYDPSNTACVSTWPSLIGHVKAGTVIEAFMLDVFPRRDRKMILRLGSWGKYGFQLGTGQFIISNPGPRTFPEWQPDPLPDTQSDGDLDVTLTKCVVGGGDFTYGGEGTLANDLTHKGVLVAFHTVQNGNVVTNWQPVAIETSDATGNQTRLYRWGINYDTNNNDVMMKYQWGLWPNETAWKLRVEMSCMSGWSAAETWQVNNVPVNHGSFLDLINDTQRRRDLLANSFAHGMINGHRVGIFPFLQTTNQDMGAGGYPGGFYVALEPDMTAGYELSAMITDAHGHKIFQNLSPHNGGGYYTFWYPDIGNAQSLNVTLALHKSRFVEFTVKPTTQ